MPAEPGLDPWMFVGSVIAHDQMQLESGRSFAVDLLEEADKFLMPVAGIQSPITWPSSMLRAANSVVVPWRL